METKQNELRSGIQLRSELFIGSVSYKYEYIHLLELGYVSLSISSTQQIRLVFTINHFQIRNRHLNENGVNKRLNTLNTELNLICQ